MVVFGVTIMHHFGAPWLVIGADFKLCSSFGNILLYWAQELLAETCVRHTVVNLSSCVAQQHPARSRAELI